MDDATVQVEGLVHEFPRAGDKPIPVLDVEHLALRARELVLMMGRAGAGKTTLLTLIGTLRRVQRGSLKVRGRELRTMDDGQLIVVRRRIGFIFQRHNLFEALTGRQNVALAAPRPDPATERELLEFLRALSLKTLLVFARELIDLGLGHRSATDPAAAELAARWAAAVEAAGALGTPEAPAAWDARGVAEFAARFDDFRRSLGPEGGPGGAGGGPDDEDEEEEARRAALRHFVADRARIAQELHEGPAREDLPYALLVFLGLGERLDHKPKALSGGQRQRVAIARALVNRPDLVLADEPTASLDRENGRVVALLLQEYAQRFDATIMLVTHDPQIKDIAHRIVTMEAGRIIGDVPVALKTEICEFLKGCPAFRELTPEEIVVAADKMTREAFPAGATVIRQGERGDKFYLIKDGEVDVLVDDQWRRTFGRGDFFGELALLGDGIRTATVRVAGPKELVVYTLGKRDFDRAREASPTFGQQVRRLYQSLDSRY